MSESDLNSPADVADEVLRSEQRERAALALLLDKALKPEGNLFVQRAVMGGSDSFVSSVPLKWIRDNVRLASQLPLFKTMIDENNRLVIDADSIDLISQRDINWSRQQELAQYLVTRLTHKFPPILAVITAPWVDAPGSDAWGADGKAVRSVVDFNPLDNKREVGLLAVDYGFSLYALDGQHRKIGIDGAIELVNKGRLQVLNPDGDPKKGEFLELDEILMEYDLDAGIIQQLPAERMGIEIIPAVIAGETREEAQRRIRSVFTHVNKQAAPLTQGQVAQLDEDNGFAIVARNEAVQHVLLKKKTGRAARVDFNSSTISLRSQTLTTLQTLKEMAQRYLSADPDYQGWKAKGRLLPVRPKDDALRHGQEDFAAFLEALSGLPSFQEMQRGTATADMRRLSHEKPEGGHGHMLFRPIGQIALAQAVGVLKNQDQLSLEQIFTKLAELDEQGGFRLDDPANVWYGVLFDPNSKRIRIKGRDLAAKLIRYLVTGLSAKEERDELTDDLADARYLGEDDQYRGLNGDVVERSSIKLPPIL